MKTCSKCSGSKPEDCFHKDNTKKDGLYTVCKQCRVRTCRDYRTKNLDIIKNKQKEFYTKNRQKMSQRAKEYRNNNLENIKARKHAYYLENKQQISQKRREQYQNKKHLLLEKAEKARKENPEYFKKRRAEQYLKNKQRERLKSKEWNRNNKHRVSEYVKNRRKNNPEVKMAQVLRNATRRAFKKINADKPNKTLKLLGCNVGEFIAYFEKLFSPGMTWENHGKWHIDHKVPLSAVKTKEEMIKLCHYTNLQPLWAADNIKKGDKVADIEVKIVENEFDKIKAP